MGARHDNNIAAPRVLLAGATGLIGTAVRHRLLAAGYGVLAPTRRPLPAAEGLTPLPLPLDACPKVDAYVCALGTTQRKAGSRAAFRAVDVELVLELARRARSAGARQAVVVSSIGADARSRSYYLRCKGEMEQGLASVGFERLDLLQPSLLLGAREESRPAEQLGQWLAPVVAPLMAGPLAPYRPVAAEAVAERIVTLLGEARPGVFRHRRAGQGWQEFAA